MLICSVSLRAPRAGITAAIVEVVAATDATATGNVVFATLVDDPASVGEIVDAYLGEIMLEAASASDTITAGSAYAAAVDEAVTANSVQDGTTAGAVPSRSAMLPRAFVNSSASRAANVAGTMVNL